EGRVSWMGFDDKYFLVALLDSHEAPFAQIGRERDSYFLRTGGLASKTDFLVFAGPKDFRVLGPVGFDLFRSIDLGFFSFLSQPLLVVLQFFYVFLQNYGLAIVLLTLSLKLLFLPLNTLSFRSMQSMQELQPEIKELRERVKDATQLNQEMMALYKRRGVN